MRASHLHFACSRPLANLFGNYLASVHHRRGDTRLNRRRRSRTRPHRGSTGVALFSDARPAGPAAAPRPEKYMARQNTHCVRYLAEIRDVYCCRPARRRHYFGYTHAPRARIRDSNVPPAPTPAPIPRAAARPRRPASHFSDRGAEMKGKGNKGNGNYAEIL